MTLQEFNHYKEAHCLAYGLPFTPLERFPINEVRLAIVVGEVGGPEVMAKVREFLLWGSKGGIKPQEGAEK